MIDYHETSFEAIAGEFDAVIDLTTNNGRPFGICLSARKFYSSRSTKKRLGYSVKCVTALSDTLPDGLTWMQLTLTQIASWVDKGIIVPVVDSVYPIDNYQQAFARQATREARQGYFRLWPCWRCPLEKIY